MTCKRIALVSICILICLLLTACRYAQSCDVFDTETEGIIQVSTNRPFITASNKADEPQVMDFVIADNERIKPCGSFVGDDMTIYYVPQDCIESYIDRDQNKIRNRLVYVSVTDKEGHPCEAPEIMDDIFQQLAQLERNLFAVRIYSIDEEWFVYVELNVNWWDPCIIYYYNPSQHKLIQLDEYDNREVTAIHIISKERLHSLR